MIYSTQAGGPQHREFSISPAQQPADTDEALCPNMSLIPTLRNTNFSTAQLL